MEVTVESHAKLYRRIALEHPMRKIRDGLWTVDHIAEASPVSSNPPIASVDVQVLWTESSVQASPVPFQSYNLLYRTRGEKNGFPALPFFRERKWGFFFFLFSSSVFSFFSHI
jgi:hypothetical protein